MNGKELKEKLVINLDSMVESASERIVSKTFLDKQEANVGLFCMVKEQSLSEHTSTVPAMIQAMKEAQIKLGKQDHECGSGDRIYMPASRDHALLAEEDFVFLLTLFKGSED